jgi:hypothetical protein
VIDTSLNYVTTPNLYPFNQKKVLGAQEEGQTKSFPSYTGQNPECLGAQARRTQCSEVVPDFNSL